ncbi:hypothetical protein G6F68_019816 [Rhizopus microsporus]|nr:hypothetical protein G6F68_019816 [Rhizopus microsporus]
MLEAESVLQEIAAARGMARNEIRVAAVEGVARIFVPSVMARFHQERPNIRFDLFVGSPAERAVFAPRAGARRHGVQPSAGRPPQRQPAGP